MTLNYYYATYRIMRLRYQKFDDFLAFNKPFAFRTHKVADDQYGFVEFASEKLGQELWVTHRLDKETSGLILFATNKEAAADLAKLFEQHHIKKTYLFLTDEANPQTSFTVTSHIEKQDHFFINSDDKPDNSETSFEFVQNYGKYNLWKAFPKTGKPHQIRLHAQKAGIPVLGDNQHGGSIHHRLALHAHKIEFKWKGEDLVIQNQTPAMLSLFEDCFYSRHNLYNIPSGESYRLVHHESPNLRADVFGDRLWVYDYSDKGLSENSKQEIQKFSSDKNLIAHIRHMLDRGQGVGGLEKDTLVSQNDENWTAQEETSLYSLKTDSGFSPGLFLDQRENRKYIRSHSADKRVLNLFSYTSGFSVQAALGGAKEVTTVDVSKKFLDWSRENFKLNNLDSEKYEFFSQDTIVFLKGSVKRQRQWDLIICDPPSFGRSKVSVWKIEKDLPELAQLLLQCLAKKGELLFTCNLEKKSRDEIIKLFTSKIKNQPIKIKRMPMMALDYEVTDDLNNLMKGFILQKG